MAKDIEIIKKPHQKEFWTKAQLLEIAKCTASPKYFIKKYVKTQHPLKGSVPLELYPYQEKIIESFKENRNTILLTGRQLGKCIFGNTKITFNKKEVQIRKLIKLSLKQKIVDYLEITLVKLAK